MNSEHEVEHAYNSTAIHDGQTGKNTEFDEKNSEMNGEHEVEQAGKYTAIHDDQTGTKPEIDEENTEMNAEHEVEQADNSSAIQDVQTRSKTEFDDELPQIEIRQQLEAVLVGTMKINGNGKQKDLKIIDCVIIGEFVVFVDNFTESLTIHQKRGSFERDIKLSGVPQVITAINDKEVAVLDNKSLIQIISINTGHVQNEIRTRDNGSKGISYQNGLLFIYVVHEMCIIDVINLEGYNHGNQYKELLTEKDGLVYPRGIHYDKTSNYMLVCNECNRDAFLFHVRDLS